MKPQQVIDDVTKETPGLYAACALTLDESKGGFYVMWTTPVCAEKTVALPVNTTSKSALAKHWKAFVAGRIEMRNC